MKKTNANSVNLDILPNGKPFAFWEDRTRYNREHHVAANDARADDANEGSADAPLATINRAAMRVRPGERVIVHEGVYRECVRPARSGLAPDQMIAYEAATGEDVVIAGSDLWHPDPQPSQGWRQPKQEKERQLI